MNFIKINKARETNPTINLFICAEDISSYYFDSVCTVVRMKNGDRWELVGDMTKEISKIISGSISGKVIPVE